MIPGQFVALITFPGVIVHEIAHQLFCKMCRVAVLDVCYLRVGNPAGYVIHEIPNKASQQILIGIGPFIVNSLLGALIALPAAIPLQFDAGSPLDWFLIWLGLSIAMHAFPSTGDAKCMWSAAWGRQTSILPKLVVSPLVVLIYIGAIGSVIWLDLFYGIGLVILVRSLLVGALT